MQRFWFLVWILVFLTPSSTYGKVDSKTADSVEKSLPNLFAKHFFLDPDQRLQHETIEARGFVFVEAPNRKHDSRLAVVTDFGGSAIKTRAVPNLNTLQEARKWIKKNLETTDFENVEIKRLPLSGKGESAQYLYWVGHRAFRSAEKASAEIAMVKAMVESQGGNFKKMVKQARTALLLPDEEPPMDIKPEAQFISEEKLALKYLDQLNVGTKLFGPFQGVPTGEGLLWQSFGETTWRQTNLEETDFQTQIGFWTNRFVFKGIRAPLITVDPYVEATTSIEALGVEFKSNVKFYGGLEWRPFARNPWLQNTQPMGIPLLDWIRSYRFYLQYGVRENIKDEITGSANHDLHAGVQIFYEWGIDLPPLNQADPITFSDYFEEFVWGEYFGNYRYEMTNFGAEDDYDGIILNSNIMLGVKLPAIPLPDNAFADNIVLMPYMRFEHVNSDNFSFPFQNFYFLAAGVRWMPFRSYRFKENEWLSKTKLFAEYVGIGKTHHLKQDGEAPHAIRDDIRFGISVSSRRF